MPSIGLFPQGSVDFTGGRHRFAWLRDHGAICSPVTVCNEELVVIAARFCCEMRECVVVLKHTSGSGAEL